MAITQTVLESPIELVGVPTRCDANRTSTAAMPAVQPPENEAIDTATVDNTDNNGGDNTPQSNPKRSGLSILLVMAPLCLSSFLAALDLTIVTPAIPTIVSSFHAASGYVWIGSAFILAYTAVTPVWGSLADIWGRKPVMLLALTFFLGGSLLCALAPTMDSLIGGRVVLGLGASGMSVLTNTIICDTFSMRDRSLYLAITSLVWAVGSAIGPVLGGIFATQVGWRWCFWINLPLGSIVFLVIAVFLSLPSADTPVLSGLKAIDWSGCVLIIGGILMVLLALDFGDNTYAWDSPMVICLLVFGAVAVGIFAFNETKVRNPVIPLRLFSTLSNSATYVVFSLNSFTLIGLTYYLPLYSQSVLGADALQSGLHLLPIIIGSSLSAALTGLIIQKTGRYLELMYVAQVLTIVGVGLLISLDFEQDLPKLLGFQVIVGVGVGMNIEPPLIAAQASMTVTDTAAVVATMGFCRSITTAISVVIGGVLFQNAMASGNGRLQNELGNDTASLFNGAVAAENVEVIASLPENQQPVVREAYFWALRSVWVMYIVVAGVSLLSNLLVRAKPLSHDVQEVVLGIDRKKQGTTQPESTDQQSTEATPEPVRS